MLMVKFKDDPFDIFGFATIENDEIVINLGPEFELLKFSEIDLALRLNTVLYPGDDIPVTLQSKNTQHTLSVVTRAYTFSNMLRVLRDHIDRSSLQRDYALRRATRVTSI